MSISYLFSDFFLEIRSMELRAAVRYVKLHMVR